MGGIRASLVAMTLGLAGTAAGAAEVPPTAFYSGNDIYDWCRNDRRAAFSYVAGLYDAAAHAAAVIDSGRHFGKDSTNNDVEIDSQAAEASGNSVSKQAGADCLEVDGQWREVPTYERPIDDSSDIDLNENSSLASDRQI